MRKSCIILLIIISSFNIPLFADDKAVSADVSSSITIEELKDKLYFLASDGLEGRRTGSEGYRIAAGYVVSQFREAGLKPFFDASAAGAGYYQPFKLIRTDYSRVNPVVLSSGAGESILQMDTDLKPVNIGRNDLDAVATEVVFIGYGIVEPDYGWDDLSGKDIKGKTVVMIHGSPRINGKWVLPGELSELYEGFVGIGKRIGKLRFYQPATVVIIPRGVLAQAYSQISMRHMLTPQPTFEMVQKDRWAGEFNLPTVFIMNPQSVGRLFAGQDWSLDDIENCDSQAVRRFTFDNLSMTTSFEADSHEISCENVIGYLPGTDETVKDEYLVLGAHLDHMGIQDGEVMNGADDNASGVAAVMEIAEALAMDPPRRPVIFIAFDSEEAGLIGARFFVSSCPVGDEKIMAYVNLDSLSRSEEQFADTRTQYAIGAKLADPRLQDIMEKVNGRSVAWPLAYEHPLVAGVEDTDSYPFYLNGIPTVCFASGYSEQLHTPQDDPETVDFDKFINISRLACHLVIELANLDTPLLRQKN